MAIDKIKWRINKVLPLVYDDTLSYYETLCKVIAKCNEVIEEINELTAEVNSQGVQIAQLGQRMTTAETNIGVLQSNVAEHANELGILIPKVQLLEQEIANIPTYSAGRGITIEDGEITAMNNIGAKDISSEVSGASGIIVNEDTINWLENGAPIIIDSPVTGQPKVTLYMTTYGAQFVSYRAEANGYIYSFRYNHNTQAYSWSSAEIPVGKMYLHTMTITNQLSGAYADVYAYSVNNESIATATLDATEAQNMVVWFNTVLKAGVTDYVGDGMTADFSGTEITSIWINTDNDMVTIDIDLMGNISTMFVVPIDKTTIVDTVTEVK